MGKVVEVLIVGGGISGLTLANLLINNDKKVIFNVTIFESRIYFDNNPDGIAGGIGIWPPGQSVLHNIPEYAHFIDKFGFYMPFPAYRDANGKILANPTDSFSKRFPVLCLNRDDLTSFLRAGLKNSQVRFVNSAVHKYERAGEKLLIKTNDCLYEGDLLIACDGIHSKIRNCLQSELKRPAILETASGYTYFRANTTIPLDSTLKWWDQSFEIWGKTTSRKYGNYKIRFGYVPLKPPTVFWFIAIKTQKNHPFLSPVKKVQTIDQETAAYIRDLVKTWKPIYTPTGEEAVNYEILMNLTHEILRTDIEKIREATQFPWISQDKRVILMGDAAHAIAPNLAQGAGLCMEDAACLAARLNRVDYLEGLYGYEKERKSRIGKVSKGADWIAIFGQLENPLALSMRDGFMRTSRYLFPDLQHSIFEYLVSVSLGGSTKKIYWQPPRLFTGNNETASLFANIVPTGALLADCIRNFKISEKGGTGKGYITVKKYGFFANFFGIFKHFPAEMEKQPFFAEVINVSNKRQLWKRIFGFGTSKQKTVTTSISTFCDFKRNTYLSEGAGNVWDKCFRFLYTLRLKSDGTLHYESKDMSCFDLFKIPFSSFLLPKSSWSEKLMDQGWEFKGKISAPLLGTLLQYQGYFEPDKIEQVNNKRIIIAGGSGMIGTALCIVCIRKGYDVYCLSRSRDTVMPVEGVKVRCIDEDWSSLIDGNTIIINLGGSNPGKRRWTSTVKKTIKESRFRIIDTIIRNIEKAVEKPFKFLQASATGFYGNVAEEILTEKNVPPICGESGTVFRMEVCREIEQHAEKANCNVINLRMGHVLSNNGGFLPYLKLASFFRVKKMGSGQQYIPFVHINDVVNAIEFIASSDELNTGAINITSPNPCTNFQLLAVLNPGWGIIVPAFILKLLIGESFVIVTDSQRIMPERLLKAGFRFNYTTIQEALQGLQ